MLVDPLHDARIGCIDVLLYFVWRPKKIAIHGTGWELLIKRERQDKRNGKTRTVGKYQVFHDGLRLFRVYRAPLLSHPGQATIPGGNRRRVEAGKYPLRTQAGT